jgi:hypothetical protein
MLIAASYIAHKFAAQQCGLLHKDISPNNIFILVKAATPADAVPDFDLPDNFNQSPRKYQLGDWGLCMPLKGCKFESALYKVPDEKWSGSSVVPDRSTVQDHGHSGVTAPQDNFKKERRKHLNQPPGAFNHTVC